MFFGHVQADTAPLKSELLATNLGVPWGMAILPDGLILVSQREGKLSLVNTRHSETTTIDGLPDIFVAGQGGLLDVALSPDYESTQWLYFSYVKNIDGQGATTLARAKLIQHELTEWQDLLVTKSTSPKQVHFGGRITFDHHGHLFLSVGERGVRENAQDRLTHAGSILRLNLDGSIPTDNPFVENKQALPEIWSYGHRNPQGLFYNHKTEQLWAIEHGPRGGDEINLIHPGKNYGWPVISYGKEYWGPIDVGEGTHREGMEQPVQIYVPSIAPSSLIQYQGSRIPSLTGKLVAGALKQRHLNVITLNSNNEAIDEEKIRLIDERIRNIIESNDGALLVSTDNGNLYRITHP
jgi:glucose/arabinose dehydrogenase